jgi:hypothetical protein
MSKNHNKLFRHFDPDFLNLSHNRVEILGPAMRVVERAVWVEDPQVAHEAEMQFQAENRQKAFTANEAASLATLAIAAEVEGQNMLQSTSPEVIDDKLLAAMQQSTQAGTDDRQVPMLGKEDYELAG